MDKSTAIQRLTQIKTLENLRAVPPGLATSKAVPEAAQMAIEQVSPDAKADMKTLQDAGWTFEAPADAPDETSFDVVMDTDGHLKLSGRALTVKLDPGIDPAEVTTLLGSMGLKLRRELGFAPNTFLIEAEAGSALQAARQLNDLPEVLYAEPNLVEAMTTRR